MEPLVTAEEFAHMPTHERFELVRGRLVPMSPPNIEHGRIVLQLGYLLKAHLEKRSEGVAVVDAGFTLSRNPDTVRGPDVAFIRHERMPAPPARRGFPALSPDAVFEVLSPDDRAGAIRAKIGEYLDSGTRLVVIVDPRDHVVVVHRAGTSPVTHRQADDVVDLSAAIPGFTCRVNEIFD